MSESQARETTTRHATHRTAWSVGALAAVLLIVVLSLAQIDPRQYEIDLRQAQAALLKDQSALDQARSDLTRYQTWAAAGPDSQLDDP